MMKYPLRSHFSTFVEYEMSFSMWGRSCDRMAIRLRGMYDATAPTTSLPEWATEGREDSICHVELPRTPDETNLQVCIDNLSGWIVGKDKAAIRVAHGIFDGFWACYVECVPEGDEKAVAA